MPNLYQLTNEMVVLEAQIIAEGGEMTDEERGILDGLKMEFDEKGENIIMAIRNYEAISESNKKEATFFSDRAKVAANKAKALKKYLQDSMESLAMEKHEFGKFKATLQKSSMPRVDVTESDKVPQDFIRVIREIDKSKAIQHLRQTGEEIPGLEFSWSRYLRIN